MNDFIIFLRITLKLYNLEQCFLTTGSSPLASCWSAKIYYNFIVDCKLKQVGNH